MSDTSTSTFTEKPGVRASLHGLDPGELLARGLESIPVSPTAGRWEPPSLSEMKRLLPQYEIEGLLGYGGMGAVYRAMQPALDRTVAIKLLPAEIAVYEQFVGRFQREARTLARLHHPGIVAIHDFGQTDEGHLYFVMEYVDGTDLRRVLQGPGLQPDQALVLVSEVCEALHYAHSKEVIHRDIKPANILLTVDGHAKLADFGLSRPANEETGQFTSASMILGTSEYMAPEQREGQVDRRADIFSLGVTLYEMLTGERPSGAFEPASSKSQVDARIDEVVIKALQEEPAHRYQDASQMKTDVDQIRTTAAPVVPALKPGRSRRNAGIVLAGTGLGVVALCVAAIFWRPDRAKHTGVVAGSLTATGMNASASTNHAPEPSAATRRKADEEASPSGPDSSNNRTPAPTAVKLVSDSALSSAAETATPVVNGGALSGRSEAATAAPPSHGAIPESAATGAIRLSAPGGLATAAAATLPAVPVAPTAPRTIAAGASFEEMLVSGKWSWVFVSQPAHENSLRFYKSGTAQLEGGWIGHWQTTAPQTVKITVQVMNQASKGPNNIEATLKFDPEADRFHGLGFSGHDGVIGVRKEIAENQPPMAAPGTDPVAGGGELEIFAKALPQAMDWIAAPLSAKVPATVRSQIVSLGAALKEEAVKSPQASPYAYALADRISGVLTSALNERDHSLQQNNLVANGRMTDAWTTQWAARTSEFQAIVGNLFGQLRNAAQQSPIPALPPRDLLTVDFPAIPGLAEQVPPPGTQPDAGEIHRSPHRREREQAALPATQPDPSQPYFGPGNPNPLDRGAYDRHGVWSWWWR